MNSDRPEKMGHIGPTAEFDRPVYLCRTVNHAGIYILCDQSFQKQLNFISFRIFSYVGGMYIFLFPTTFVGTDILDAPVFLDELLIINEAGASLNSPSRRP